MNIFDGDGLDWSMLFISSGKSPDCLNALTAFCKVATDSHDFLKTAGKNFLVRTWPRLPSCHSLTFALQQLLSGEKIPISAACRMCVA